MACITTMVCNWVHTFNDCDLFIYLGFIYLFQMIYLGFVIKLSDIRSIFVKLLDHCVHVFGAVCFLLWKMPSKLLFYLWCPIKVPFIFKKKKKWGCYLSTISSKHMGENSLPCFVVSGSCSLKIEAEVLCLKECPCPANHSPLKSIHLTQWFLMA